MTGRNGTTQRWFTVECSTGKRGYASRKDAKTARRISPQDGGKLNAYHCTECDYWHLGRLPSHVTRGYGERPRA